MCDEFHICDSFEHMTSFMNYWLEVVVQMTRRSQ